MRRIAITLLTTLLLPAAALGQVAAKILSIQGRVEVQQSPWTPASVNQTLAPGTAIRTGDQSRAVILLADETQIKINSNSQLVLKEVRQSSNLLARVVQASGRSDLNLLKGETWLRSKQRPVSLQVSTPGVTAAIRGTEFDIKVADDGETIATVLEGSIDMRNDQGFVIVNSREQGRARIGQAPTKTVILNPEDAVQWTLFYSAAVSPRDYPFQSTSPEQAKSALAAAAADPVRTAQLQHDAGDLKAALAAIQGVSTPEAAETRGWILLEQNRIREAIEELNRAPSQSPRARLGLSMAYYRLNQFSEAYDHVQDPGTDSRLILQKAQLELVAGDPASSRNLLESVQQSHPAYALVQALLSNVYLTQNNKDKALAAAQRAIQADPNSPSAHLSLSLVQQSMFDLAGATRSVEKALALDPDFLQGQVQYAKLLYGAGNSGKAEEVIRRSLSLAPEEAAVHSTLGFILLGRGQTNEARTTFERSLQLDSGRGEPHLGIGIANMRQARHSEAVTEFLAAASLEPRISLYQSYLGKAFYEQRKFEQAFTAVDAAKQLDPRDPTPSLYSGIFDNDLKRPGEAIREFENSIRLNDNRAVYRSKFLLDEDRATRNVNLATAYNRLGLSEWANLHAVNSELSDPTNSSAHLFLANTFLNLKGRTLAAGGELLLARLLLPVNTNSFNAFNDYTTLFELPRLNWTVEGSGGSFNTTGSSLIASGGARRYAYSTVVRSNDTDGWRPVNDDSKDYNAVNFFKLALTPHSDFLFSYVYGQVKGGDHGGASPLVTADNNTSRRNYVRSNRAEIGYHQRFRPGSEFVFVLSGQTDYFLSDDPKGFVLFRPPFKPVNVNVRLTNRSPDIDVQAMHLLKISKFQFRYGLDIFEGRAKNQVTNTFPNPADPTDIIVQQLEPEKSKVRYRSAFLRSDYIVSRKLTVTAGLNYDWANYRLSIVEEEHPFGKWNPQVGFLFTPLEATAFRFAAARVLQTNQQERLVPTHVDGFPLNQNELTLTLSNTYNFGWDQRFSNRSFLRTTAFKRDRAIPTLDTLPSGDIGRVDIYGDFYGAGTSFSHFLSERWTLVPDYALTHSRDFYGVRHDHEANLGLFYIHPRGFTIGVKENYLNQHGLLGAEPTSVSVFTTNATFSYEFPRKIGLLSLVVNNLTDRHYSYLADPLALDPRIPKRQIRALMRFYF